MHAFCVNLKQLEILPIKYIERVFYFVRKKQQMQTDYVIILFTETDKCYGLINMEPGNAVSCTV
jgi:hypothetical protein